MVQEVETNGPGNGVFLQNALLFKLALRVLPCAA